MHREGKVSSDAAWRVVKLFKEVDSARLRYLTRDECVRLVNACDPDFSGRWYRRRFILAVAMAS